MFVFLSLALALSLTFNSSSPQAGQQFTAPSQAYAFVKQPTKVQGAEFPFGTVQSPEVNPKDEVRQRAETWCPAFAVEKQSGEELYYLGLLCRDALKWQKARAAIEQYLSQQQPSHAPDARLLLVFLDHMLSDLDRSWQTLYVVFEKDPLEYQQSLLADSLLDDEAAKDEATALAWSRERYSLLLNRAQTPTPGAPQVSFQWPVLAGIDLVHRDYLTGKNDEAQKVLQQLNRFKTAHPGDIAGSASDSLRWANMEMHPAPPLPVQKLLSSARVSQVIQKGRVEVLSFFFLGCAPCMSELPDLNDLQKRYPKKNVLVAGITTYKANSSLDPAPHSKIETALNQTRLKNAPELSMVVTPDEALANYGVNGFPVIAVIDKKARLRYIGRETDFDEDEPIGRLVLSLTKQ
jgi:thiol-disulfide isomerase/thioredoxin